MEKRSKIPLSLRVTWLLKVRSNKNLLLTVVTSCKGLRKNLPKFQGRLKDSRLKFIRSQEYNVFILDSGGKGLSVSTNHRRSSVQKV